MCWMEKSLVFNKRVGPNKHVGWNFSKILINVQLGSCSENLSKIFIRNKKLEIKVQNHNLASNKHLNIY